MKHRNRVVRGSKQVPMYQMQTRKQIHENAQADVMDQNSCRKDWENGEGVIWESHDLVRRMDRQGEVLIWCRKCSGYARQRMGTKN